MLLLGHRGARRYAPENTLAAFELALEHGCDGFEFDVRLTADRRCAICHDPRIGGRKVEASRYDQLPPETPWLPDVLARFANRAFLDIELKVAGMEAEVAALLRTHPLRCGGLISSFLPEVVDRLHAADPALRLGLICDSERQLAACSSLPIQALFLERKLVNPTLIQQRQAVQQEVFVWTVNGEDEMRRVAALGVDGIISDDTKLLAETLGGTTSTS